MKLWQSTTHFDRIMWSKQGRSPRFVLGVTGRSATMPPDFVAGSRVNRDRCTDCNFGAQGIGAMNALACVLATSITAAGVDYGWQPTNGGDLEYVIQIEPALLESLKSGQEITSEIPPELAGVRRFRIRVGSGPVPKIPLNNPQFRPRPGVPGRTAANVTTPATAKLGGFAPPTPASHDSAPSSAAEWPRGRMTPRMASNEPQAQTEEQSRWADRAQSALDRLNRAKAGGANLYDPQGRGMPPLTATVSDAHQPAGTVRIPPEQSPAAGQPRPGPATAAIGDRSGGFQAPLDPRHRERYQNPTGNGPVSPAIDFPSIDRQPIPSRPHTTGQNPSNGYQPPPQQPNLRSEFRPSDNTTYPQDRTDSALSSATPRSTLPFGQAPNSATAATRRDPTSREPDGLFPSRSVTEASYTESATSTPSASIQLGRPSLPESAALQPYKPWGWFVAVLFGFLISLSANFYLGWIAYDLHRRYRSAVLQMTDAAALGV